MGSDAWNAEGNLLSILAHAGFGPDDGQPIRHNTSLCVQSRRGEGYLEALCGR